MTPPPDLPTIWLAGLEGCALCRRRHAAHKASSMRTQPAGSSCLSVRAAGPSDNPCQSSPLWRECPLPRTCAQEGEIPRRARALANRHRVRLRRHRNRRRPIFFTRRAAFQARRRGLGRLGQALPPPRKVQPGIPRAVPCLPCCHAALPAPHIRSCSGSRLCVLHRLHSTSRSTQKLESHNRHWKSHQPKPAAGNGGGSGVSIGVVVSAAGGSGRLSCAPARCQMCTDLARARVGAHAAPDLEHRSPRSCRPGSRSS